MAIERALPTLVSHELAELNIQNGVCDTDDEDDVDVDYSYHALQHFLKHLDRYCHILIIGVYALGPLHCFWQARLNLIEHY